MQKRTETEYYVPEENAEDALALIAALKPDSIKTMASVLKHGASPVDTVDTAKFLEGLAALVEDLVEERQVER